MKQKIKDFFERKTRKLVRWAFSSRIRVYSCRYTLDGHTYMMEKNLKHIEELIKSELRKKIVDTLEREDLVEIHEWQNPQHLGVEYTAKIYVVK